MYTVEQATETARVAKMREDERDSHDIQHAVKICRSPKPKSVVCICRPASARLLHMFGQRVNEAVGSDRSAALLASLYHSRWWPMQPRIAPSSPIR